MQVSRCCCDVDNTLEVGRSFIELNRDFMMWRSLDGELDPIEFDLSFLIPNLVYSNQERPACILGAGGTIGGSTFPIPVRTYSTAYFHTYNSAVDEFGAATATDTPQDYDIYLVDQVADFATFISNHVVSGIDRADLLGPVTWNASTQNWGLPAYRDTPDLVSMCNTLINGGSWASSSCLVFVWDVKDQYAGHPAPGRVLGTFATDAKFVMTW